MVPTYPTAILHLLSLCLLPFSSLADSHPTFPISLWCHGSPHSQLSPHAADSFRFSLRPSLLSVTYKTQQRLLSFAVRRWNSAFSWLGDTHLSWPGVSHQEPTAERDAATWAWGMVGEDSRPAEHQEGHLHGQPTSAPFPLVSTQCQRAAWKLDHQLWLILAVSNFYEPIRKFHPAVQTPSAFFCPKR